MGPRIQIPARIRVRLLLSPPQTFLLGLQCPVRLLTQGEGQEQWQGAGAAAGDGPVHQPRAAGPRSPWTSLPPPPAPLSQASGVRRGAWKLISGQQETKLLLRLEPWLQGKQTPRAAADRLRECCWEERASYLSSLTPHQRGAGLRGGSVQVVPTQITPQPHPHSSSYWGCLRACSATPPAGSHLTLPVPLSALGSKQVGRQQGKNALEGCQMYPKGPAGLC